MVVEYQRKDISKAQQDEAIIWKNQGNEHFKQGNYFAALSCYDNGLKLDPSNRNLWNNKALSLYQLGRKEEALKCKEIIQNLQTNEFVEEQPSINEEKITFEENSGGSRSSTPVLTNSQTIQRLNPPMLEEIKIDSPKNARIHGTSGSTKFLLHGMKPISGKELTTLKDVYHFHKNYETILAETEIAARNQQEQRLSQIIREEEGLESQLKAGIAQQTIEVEKHIDTIKNQIQNSDNFFRKLILQFQYWLEVRSRSSKIQRPFSGLSKELRQVKTRKETLIQYKDKNIQNERNRVSDSYQFLEQNKSFLIGAQGEELVIKTLSQLPEDYHILNDVNLHFNPPLYWKEKKNHILSSQIDHIVVGPTGIFLIETKKWKQSDVELKNEDLIFQVRRSSYALWRYLINYYRRKEKLKIWNVVVSTQGSGSNRRLDKFIDIISPYELPRYITRGETTLSSEEIEKLVQVIPWR